MSLSSSIDRPVGRLHRFARSDDGAILVEFALVLPLMLLFFAVSIESARMLWSYQQAVSGVRDAGRYLGRAAPYETCPGWTAMSGPMAAKMLDIVEDDMQGVSIFKSGVTVNTVDYSIACIDDSGGASGQDNFADDKVMIATVTADVTIAFPLGSVFRLFGGSLTGLNTSITDQVRVYGQ